jgi:hypothetical protein
MRIALPIALSSTLAACVHTTAHLAYVPLEEAAWFKMPYELPEAGKKALTGTMAQPSNWPWRTSCHGTGKPVAAQAHKTYAWGSGNPMT